MSEEIANLLELVTAGEWGNNQGAPGGVDTGVIRSANFTKDHQFNTKEIVVRSIEERKRQKKMLQHGDILIEKSGGSPDQPVGRVLFYDLKGEHTCSNFISILRPSQQVDPKFLYYSLCNLYGRGVVKNYQQQTTGIINLQLGEYMRETIYHPPLPVQKRIAEILSGIDRLTQGVRAKVDKLKAIRNAFIQNLHENNPLKWVALGEISDFVTSGSRGWSQYYSSKGPRFVRIGNLSRNSIDLDPTPGKWQLVEPPEGAEGARTKLEDGDLLISITADLGICSIYSMSIGEAYINQHIALVRLDAQHRNYARQVAYYICSEHCQEQIRSMNDSGAKAGLNLDSIRRVQVPLIEYGEENNKIQSIDALQSSISGNLALLDHYAHEKSSISSDLLSGRKRVSI